MFTFDEFEKSVLRTGGYLPTAGVDKLQYRNQF
jgi:hypothetical protein